MLEEGSSSAISRLFYRTMHGPGHKVDRTLAEGDEVAGFRVLDAPGHSKGQVAFWRESDRVLVLGDVLNSMDVYTGVPGLAAAQGRAHRRPGAEPRVRQAAG